jgi:Ca2+-binding RTX toxin-like protein
MIETLEARRLLSTVFNAASVEVTGNAKANVIDVTVVPVIGGYLTTVVEDGASHSAVTSTGLAIVRGNGANDTIRIHSAQNTQIFGGDGKDIITGGDGSDVVDGGAGADVINTGAGDDTVTMGDQDHVNLGAGSDLLITSVNFRTGTFADGGTDSSGGIDTVRFSEFFFKPKATYVGFEIIDINVPL